MSTAKPESRNDFTTASEAIKGYLDDPALWVKDSKMSRVRLLLLTIRNRISNDSDFDDVWRMLSDIDDATKA